MIWQEHWLMLRGDKMTFTFWLFFVLDCICIIAYIVSLLSQNFFIAIWFERGMFVCSIILCILLMLVNNNVISWN